MFTGSILCSVTKVLLPLLRPLNFVLGDKHQIRCRCRCEPSAKNGGAELTHDDVAVVMAALGIGGWSGSDKCKERCLEQGVRVLLEEKQASWEELEEAFSVFDCDGDGFISPVELHNVMGSLGLPDNSQDCKRMVQVFDKDGDGVISFDEFKGMMQGAI